VSDALARLVVVILVVVQAASFIALARSHQGRLVRFGALACPLVVLAVCLARMGPLTNGSDVTPLEQAFLGINVANAIGALVLLLRNGGPKAAAWAVWLVNSASCAAMVYLAFFFRLF